MQNQETNGGMKNGNLFTVLIQFIISKLILRIRRALVSNKRESRLSDSDRRLFESLCQFIWIQGDPLPLVFDIEDGIYTKQGITLATLKRLEELDLIIFEPYGYIKKGFGKHTRLFYFGRPTKIGFKNNENNQLDLGHVLLTHDGKKLASTSKSVRNHQFYEYVINKWFQEGLILSSIQIDKNHNYPTR